MPHSNGRYQLGLPEMDEQHNYLYSLFDLIEQSTQVSNRPSTLLLAQEIERYVLFHFECEERLMRHYSFPGFAVHQTDHEQAGGRLVQFLDDLDSGRLNPAAMRIFLTGWLMEHSKVSDAEYVAWVKARREEVKAAQRA